MREPNFSSGWGPRGSWPGGFEVVKPPTFGLGRMAVRALGFPGVLFGVTCAFRLAIKVSPVIAVGVPCILTVNLCDSSSFSVEYCDDMFPLPEVQETVDPSCNCSSRV